MPVKRGAPLVVHLEDIARLRKPHPCGSLEWTVVRLGADIGIRCNGCNRKVLLSRREFEKRLKLFVSRGPEIGVDRSEADAAGEFPLPDTLVDPSEAVSTGGELE